MEDDEVADMVVDAMADKVADLDRSGQTETDRDRTGQIGYRRSL